MPYKSMKQERFAHTAAGKKAFGQKNVNEFDQASKGLKLPMTANPKLPSVMPRRQTQMLKGQ